MAYHQSTSRIWNERIGQLFFASSFIPCSWRIKVFGQDCYRHMHTFTRVQFLKRFWYGERIRFQSTACVLYILCTDIGSIDFVLIILLLIEWRKIRQVDMRAQNLLICKFSVLAGIIMVAVSPVTFCYLIMGIPEAKCIFLSVHFS